MQALNKATHFFENNLELLATIAQLKRESASHIQNSRRHEEKLNGRIECLMQVVQQQQAKLDAQERLIALKGIWANLIQTRATGKDQKKLEDDCSAVITWLSLQCAQDASRSGNELLEEDKGVGRGGKASITMLLDRIHEMHYRCDEIYSGLGKENSDLRRVLQGNAARREGDKKQIEELTSRCAQLSEQLKQSASKIRYVLLFQLPNSLACISLPPTFIRQRSV